MNVTKKRVLIGATVAALALSGTGIAYAYWTTSGNGSGTATTASGAANLSIVQTVGPVNSMYPGDSAQNFTVSVTNNATNSATVAAVGAYVTTDKAGCDGSNYLINGQPAGSTAASLTALNWTSTELVAGGSASTNGSDTIQFNNKAADNQDACKGAAVTIHYVAS